MDPKKKPDNTGAAFEEKVHSLFSDPDEIEEEKEPEEEEERSA